MYFETISSAVLLDLAPNPQIWAHQYRAKIAAGKNDALFVYSVLTFSTYTPNKKIWADL